MQAILAEIFGGNCGHFCFKEYFDILHGFPEVGNCNYKTWDTKKYPGVIKFYEGKKKFQHAFIHFLF